MGAVKKSQVQPVIDVPPDNPEVALVTSAGQAISEFARGAVAFFVKAKELETQAKGRLAFAKVRQAPKTAEDDLAIQQDIKTVNAEKRALEEHWGITSRISQFHKQLVAGRQRGVVMLEEAAQIDNAHHNRYVDEQKRKAAAEQERLRREAEDQARRDREAELQRMEDAALKAESSSPNLSEREEYFVDLVANGYNNPVTAARTAGYKNPDVMAARLMDTPKIAQALQAKRDAKALRTQAAAVKEQPLNVGPVQEVKPDIARAAGAVDRTTWSAEILDEVAAVDAIIGGKHGMPRDLLMINPIKANEYARSLHKRMDLWPGMRARRKTGVV